MDCGWCGKLGRMLDLTVSFSANGGTRILSRPSLCSSCETLLLADFHEDGWDRLSEVCLYELRLLASASARMRTRASGCWHCDREAQIAELEWRDAFFDDLVLRDPRLCETCLGLLGLRPFGFANEDERRQAARLAVFIELERQAANADVPSIDRERRRSDDLILVKLALLERDAHDSQLLDDGEGYHELAGALGLSLQEAEAEVARLLATEDPPLTLRSINGVLGPRLNARGWLRVRGLQQQYTVGPPFAEQALRSRAIRRALDMLAA